MSQKGGQCLENALSKLRKESRELWVPQVVQECSTPVDCTQFLRDHVGPSIPCVWRGEAKNWIACKKWTRDNFRYLKKKIGQKVVEVTWTPNGYADAIVQLDSKTDMFHEESQVFAKPSCENITFKELIDVLEKNEENERTKGYTYEVETEHDLQKNVGIPYYSAQNSNMTTDLPELIQDIDTSCMKFADMAFGGEASAVNIWVGDGRSTTSTHADPFENIYAVITGCKVFELLPPCDAAFLQKPTLNNAIWRRKHSSTEKEGTVLSTKLQYDGWELVSEEGRTMWIDEGSIQKHTLQPLHIELHPGDLLYLPALWYHRVSQKGITIAVNWWYEMSFGSNWVYRELCAALSREENKVVDGCRKDTENSGSYE